MVAPKVAGIMLTKIIFTLLAVELCWAVRSGFPPENPQDWNYVEVREGAHMFWWLHYTIADTPSYTDRPLILWLQGGPGSSSTGYGNFEILGPLDLAENERDFTWIKTHNVLFVDNPVGTGFSYVDDLQYLTTNNTQIARDLIELLRGFYDELPEFKTVPLHVFGESYGGKMAIEFAHELYYEIQRGDIDSNFVTVAMGDSWISPIDSTLSWAPYLLQLGFIDEDGFEKINNYAIRTQRALNQGNFYQATDLWGATEDMIWRFTNGVSFYNVLYDIWFPSSEASREARSKLLSMSPRALAYETMVNRKIFGLLDDENDDEDDPVSLETMMRGKVHTALGIPDNVVWGSQPVFNTLAGDFMKPVINFVADVLTNTTLKVVVYSGQLDLICSTAGTVEWINKMNWYGNKAYKESMRYGIGVNDKLEGFKRQYDNFTMYWINNAGHMAPLDNPRAMGYVLREVTNYG